MARAARDYAAPPCHDAFGINRLQDTSVATTGAPGTTIANKLLIPGEDIVGPRVRILLPPAESRCELDFWGRNPSRTVVGGALCVTKSVSLSGLRRCHLDRSPCMHLRISRERRRLHQHPRCRRARMSAARAQNKIMVYNLTFRDQSRNARAARI